MLALDCTSAPHGLSVWLAPLVPAVTAISLGRKEAHAEECDHMGTCSLSCTEANLSWIAKQAAVTQGHNEMIHVDF